MSTLNRFNRLAPYYDTLKRLAFGRSIGDSEVHFLNRLPGNGCILILGGGSGDLLVNLFRVHPHCSVWYVEASSKMMSLAREKLPVVNRSQVTFIHGTEKTIPPGIAFDGVITNFFLDLFPDGEVLSICQAVGKQLKSEGVWLIADFVDEKWWQRLLLAVMYPFFVLTCRIQTRRLPRWRDQLTSAGFVHRSSKGFFSGFIKASIYQKAAASTRV